MLQNTHCKDYSKDYDLEKLRAVSKALGHNRVDVTVKHYLEKK